MKVSLFIIAICFSFVANAQNFFKPLPKYNKSTLQARGLVAEAETGDVTFWAIRPVASAVSLYIDGDVQALGGGGFSYQNITQRASDGRNYVNYSFNAVVGIGGAVTDSATKNNLAKAAIYIGALNNMVGLGVGTSRQTDPITLQKKWKFGLAVVWTYNFNN